MGKIEVLRALAQTHRVSGRDGIQHPNPFDSTGSTEYTLPQASVNPGARCLLFLCCCSCWPGKFALENAGGVKYKSLPLLAMCFLVQNAKRSKTTQVSWQWTNTNGRILDLQRAWWDTHPVSLLEHFTRQDGNICACEEDLMLVRGGGQRVRQWWCVRQAHRPAIL